MIYIHICIYVDIPVIEIHAQPFEHKIRVFVYIDLDVFVPMYICIYIYIYTYICMYICMYIYTYMYT